MELHSWKGRLCVPVIVIFMKMAACGVPRLKFHVRLFLAGAEVQIQARDGGVETRGRLLIAGVLPSGLKSLSSPWGLGSRTNGKRRSC